MNRFANLMDKEYVNYANMTIEKLEDVIATAILKRGHQAPTWIVANVLTGIMLELEVRARDTLPWIPIAELDEKTRYGDESGFLLLAPELVDLDCNVHGVGMGYWQDGPVSIGELEREDGAWLACKWSLTNDEWYEVPCTPTHYLRLTGAGT